MTLSKVRGRYLSTHNILNEFPRPHQSNNILTPQLGPLGTTSSETTHHRHTSSLRIITPNHYLETLDLNKIRISPTGTSSPHRESNNWIRLLLVKRSVLNQAKWTHRYVEDSTQQLLRHWGLGGGKGKLEISQRCAVGGREFMMELSDRFHPWLVSQYSSTSQGDSPQNEGGDWSPISGSSFEPRLLCVSAASPIQALARVSLGRLSSSSRSVSDPLRVARLHGLKSGRDLEPSRRAQDQWVVDRFVLVVRCLLGTRIVLSLPLLYRLWFWIGQCGYCHRFNRFFVLAVHSLQWGAESSGFPMYTLRTCA